MYYEGRRVHHRPEKKYLEGISINLALMAELYPGWVMRLYHDIEWGDGGRMEVICQHACSNEWWENIVTLSICSKPFFSIEQMF